MLRVVAGGLICVSCGYVGMQIERRYRCREKFYSDFLKYLTFARGKISSLKLPQTQIIAEFLKNGNCGSEFKKMLEAVQTAYATSGGREIVETISLKELGKRENAVFSDYFKNSGKLSVEDELRHLSETLNTVSERLTQAKEAANKEGRMYFKLSVVVGLAVMLAVL